MSKRTVLVHVRNKLRAPSSKFFMGKSGGYGKKSSYKRGKKR